MFYTKTVSRRKYDGEGRITDPEASHNVVNVLAIPRGVWTYTGAEAKLARRNKQGPLVVLESLAERVPKDEASDLGRIRPKPPQIRR